MPIYIIIWVGKTKLADTDYNFCVKSLQLVFPSLLQAKEEMAWKIAKMIIEDVKKEQTENTSAGLWTEDDDMAWIEKEQFNITMCSG